MADHRHVVLAALPAAGVVVHLRLAGQVLVVRRALATP